MGVALPFGTLVIAKQKTGALADAAAGPFAASYQCTVTPEGGSPEAVADGDGEFNVDSPLVVRDVPVGATCRVWETDTGGGDSDHTLPDDALLTVIGPQRDGDTTVTLVNDFPEPPPPPPPPPPIPGDAQLLVSKHVDLATARVGDPLNYTIVVSNAGPATATDVRVTDAFSAPVTGVATSVSQGSCTLGPPVTCTLGTLPVDGRATITLQAAGTVTGTLRNAGSATAIEPNSTPDTATASAVTTLSPGPVTAARLAVSKTPSVGTVTAPATVRYRIRVQALGSVAAVDVHVCDRLGRYLTVRSAPGGHFSGGRVCWTVASLAPGHPRTFTVTVLAHNVPRRLTAPDTATAFARNARTVRAHARLVIKPRRRPPPFTG